MSGSMVTPFFCKMASASMSVGWFAPSMRNFAFTRSAFFAVSTSPSAAGSSTSTGS